jgi:hypothetical protein
MKKLAEFIKGSFDNSPIGGSSKKLSAFYALVVMASTTQFTWLVWAYTHDNWDLLEWVLTADLIFAGTALGINSIEKIKGKTFADTENNL